MEGSGSKEIWCDGIQGEGVGYGGLGHYDSVWM